MNAVFGVVVTVLSLIAWLGQILCLVAPALAGRLGLTEPEADVDPAFYTDGRGEALWDAITLWVLPVAGILMVFSSEWWPLFGLVGGAIYAYFGGRGVVARVLMNRRGIRVGKPNTLLVNCIFLVIWGFTGVAMIVGAVLASRA
jgi:hypothetical protein